MRVARWKADKIFSDIREAALLTLRRKAEELRDNVAATVRESPIVRAPRYSGVLTTVSFTPKKGRNKDKFVSFKARVWLGRKPGDLKSTVRVVEKEGRIGNFRVIAGNHKIYWARFAEYGTRKTKRSMKMREEFEKIKPTVKPAIENGVREVIR